MISGSRWSIPSAAMDDPFFGGPGQVQNEVVLASKVGDRFGGNAK
jgi:hypothetical protein